MSLENVKCPDCDGPMISRNGKFGRFWGCKGYPNCKGTRDSMGLYKSEREQNKVKDEETNEYESSKSRRWDR